MADGIITLTDKTFDDEVARPGQPLLVDFWAEWCGPCRALAKVIDEVAAAHAGKVRVGKMNIDEERQTPSRFSVAAIPTLLIFKNGEEVGRVIGLVNRAKLDEALRPHMA